LWLGFVPLCETALTTLKCLGPGRALPFTSGSFTRPLILQCVTELVDYTLKPAVPSVISQLVGVERRSASTYERSDNRALSTTNC